MKHWKKSYLVFNWLLIWRQFLFWFPVVGKRRLVSVHHDKVSDKFTSNFQLLANIHQTSTTSTVINQQSLFQFIARTIALYIHHVYQWPRKWALLINSILDNVGHLHAAFNSQTFIDFHSSKRKRLFSEDPEATVFPFIGLCGNGLIKPVEKLLLNQLVEYKSSESPDAYKPWVVGNHQNMARRPSNISYKSPTSYHFQSINRRQYNCLFDTKKLSNLYLNAIFDHFKQFYQYSIFKVKDFINAQETLVLGDVSMTDNVYHSFGRSWYLGGIVYNNSNSYIQEHVLNWCARECKFISVIKPRTLSVILTHAVKQ